MSSAAISVDFPQNAKRPGRDVFEVADRRGDHEQRAGHENGMLIVPLADRAGRTLDHFTYFNFAGAMPVSEPLPHFVDDLLGYLHETHPTHATLDGVHTHDDLLEDLSRHGDRGARPARSPAISAGSKTSIRKDSPRLSGSNTACSRAHIRGRMFEMEEVRTGRRNPQFYADIIASSLAGQALFTHASAAERARRVLSKLRQTPRLIQTARDNIKEPPGIFVKVGIETMRGALKFIDEDLPRAFSSLDDMHLLGDLADAQTEASDGRRRVHRVPRERDGAEGARLVPARAATSSSRRSRSTKGCRCRVDRLLAIAMRELKATQEAFKTSRAG